MRNTVRYSLRLMNHNISLRVLGKLAVTAIPEAVSNAVTTVLHP
jgi:hypothetical protein